MISSGTPSHHTELATKMENKSKRNQVITYNIHPQERQLPAISINQTVLPQVESVKYLGLHFDRRLNWKVHITKKRKQTDLKAKEINWLIEKKIQPLYRKQNTSLQSGDQTHLDLQNRNLGMCQQVQHSNYADSTIKNSQNHNKFSMVCDKPYPPYRP
jgi:hypothetical protein